MSELIGITDLCYHEFLNKSLHGKKRVNGNQHHISLIIGQKIRKIQLSLLRESQESEVSKDLLYQKIGIYCIV